MRTEELAQAADDGNLTLVKTLFLTGNDIDAMGTNWSPLHAVIENERVDVIKLLLAKGADIEYVCCGRRPIPHAIDVKIDAATQTNAADYPEPIMIKLLLESGANVQSKNSDGQTALQWAQERRHAKAVDILAAYEQAKQK